MDHTESHRQTVCHVRTSFSNQPLVLLFFVCFVYFVVRNSGFAAIRQQAVALGFPSAGRDTSAKLQSFNF